MSDDSVLMLVEDDSGAMRLSSSSSWLMEISAALRLRPLAAPLVVVGAELAFLAFAVVVVGLACGELEEGVVVLKPFLMVLYCWLEGGWLVGWMDGR